MTTLVEVARAIPDGRATIAELAPELGIDRVQLGVFTRYFGLDRVCIAPQHSFVDLLEGAARALEGLAGNEHRIRYVIGARTLATVAPLECNPLHEVADRLGLSNAVVFTLTQHACASGLLAVSVAGRLLARSGDPDALALVLTGERAFSPDARLIPGTTVMGEGTAACLIAADGDGDRLCSYSSRTLGEYHRVTMPAHLVGPYTTDYVEVLADVLRDAVEQAGLEFDDIAMILPHNVNRVSWRRVARSIRVPLDRILLDNVGDFGHCFGADSFINHVDMLLEGRIAPGEHYLMASVGLGSTFSAMVFQRHGVER